MGWKILLAFTWACSLTHATIYVAAYDANTKSIGLAYSSSGANFWQTYKKGLGLIGEQASGLCDEATPAKFLDAKLSAADIVKKLAAQCDAVDYYRYRLLAITTDGKIAPYIAAEGCHSGNVHCGKVEDKDFTVLGGGLVANVLEAARTAYFATDPNVPLACRLYRTLEAIYGAGGEIKDFRGASVTVDDPAIETLQHFEARGAEDSLLPDLRENLKLGGLVCNSSR